MSKKILLALVLLLNYCDSARILGVVPTPSFSHQVFFQTIWKELALRGHEVVLLTTDPINDPSLKNLKEIDLSFSYDIWRNYSSNVIEETNKLKMVSLMVDSFHKCFESQFEHPEVITLLKNETEQFDLVMAEVLFPVVYAFKHRFNCPIIGMVSMDAYQTQHEAVGNPSHSILYPGAMLSFESDLTFLERLISVTFNTVLNWFIKLLVLPEENKIVAKHFGEGYPSIKELSSSLDMLFINTNTALNTIRPLTPATIPIGGIHIKEEKPLPKDLKKYLDESKEGVVYFSLGSNVKAKNIPAETKEVLLKVLSSIPYKVLWKLDADIPNIGSNIKIMQWLPQQDVLRHRNIKVFVTQVGKQSLEESFFSHVPMVGMPFFADQAANAKKLVSKGLGLSVDYKTLTVEKFKKVLLEVIENPKYRNKVKELAELVKDEPMTPLQRAIWWTEYVIRNKGAQHLKGPSIPFYQYYYLDVLGFVFVVISTIAVVFYWITKKIVCCAFKLICKKKKNVKKDKNI